ncbi:hypothetical protein MHU86_8821 [Fragilaria crotonensis]|nr:hypothetical protein MHU86_8821 [Fragilaria crotonensis]
MMHQNELYESAQTGQSDVTCLSFGPQRKAMYPAYFFCHGCDLFEDAILIGNKRANRVQRRYRCTGGHDDWSHPTTLMQEYRHRSNRESACIDTDDGERDKQEVNDSSTSRSATADYNSSPTKSPLKKKIRQYRGLASSTFMSNTIGTAQQQRPRRQSSSAAFLYNYYREESSSEGVGYFWW